MNEIYLIISIVMGGAQPSMTFTKQPDLRTCWAAAEQYLEQHKNDASAMKPQLGAGCGVAYVPGRAQ